MNEEAAQAAHDYTEDTSASENAAAESGEGNTSSSEGAVEDAELAKAKAEAEDYQQRYLRAQADFDNFRRRTLKEKEDFAKYASAKLVTELLPVLDNFERALATEQASSEAESFIKGVDMIFRQLGQVLEQEGVKPMEAVGQPFNPEFHQAVMTVDTDEYEEGVVVEELQKGYMLKDKVLRPAMVKVSG
ncbi:nucleotide exchange factor GrpE [Paenibacillus alvei]|uniref:Protein GrpE n=2 Tax=Paenibacillus alvei TaxID=44250 RepID=A0AAP6ZTY6_PAEAL|nr:nucleotide exchange factor GrpE [Paenibacillus alvei]